MNNSMDTINTNRRKITDVLFFNKQMGSIFDFEKGKSIKDALAITLKEKNLRYFNEQDSFV